MWGELRNAFTILTILPLEGPVTSPRSDPARSATYFPVVGAFIGGVLWAVDFTGGFLPAGVRAALLLIASTAVTGGLHLDGLADTCDGIFSRAGRERALEIMRDSRLGALGATGLVLTLLLKFGLLTELAPAYRALTLFLMPVCGRQAMVLLMSIYPYARRAEGLGGAFAGRVGGRQIRGSLILTICLILAGALLSGAGKPALAGLFSGFVLTFGLVYLVSRYVAARLGGMTGDTYGAANEAAELVFLFFAAAALKG